MLAKRKKEIFFAAVRFRSVFYIRKPAAVIVYVSLAG